MHDNRYLIFLSQYHGLVLPNTRIRVAVSQHGRFRLTQPSTPSRVSLDKAFNGNFLPTLRNAKLAGTLVLQPQADVQLFSQLRDEEDHGGQHAAPHPLRQAPHRHRGGAAV